jgi:hypothetical protein
MRRNLSMFGTAAIVCFLAVAIVMLIAGAVEDATKPSPGWVPTPSATSTR